MRLQGYDYGLGGAYFMTIVCKDRALLFENDTLRDLVDGAWRWLGQQYPHAELDEYVIMPNHLHGIIVLRDAVVGGSRTAPTTPALPRKVLGSLVGAFKTVSTKRINQFLNTPGVQRWQRNYWERIIRDEDEMNRIRQYIIENPARWEEDQENPAARLAISKAKARR
jgi:putative transposase